MDRAGTQNYTVQEKECLGVVHGVQKFRHYLPATPFQVEILTDHKSLQHCLDATHDKTKGQRIARWSLYLSDFNYKVMGRNFFARTGGLQLPLAAGVLFLYLGTEFCTAGTDA